MGRLKLILGGLVVLVVGVVVAGVAILKSTDFNQYKGEITEQAKAATGRDLMINGDLSLDISLSPKVRVDGITLSNAEWGSNEHMVKVKSFAAQMKLVPLLFGDIHIVEVALIEPEILLETKKDGTGNWVMGPQNAETEETATTKTTEQSTSSGSTTLPAVNKIRIEKARFIYKDGVKDETTSIVIDSMQATADDIDDPLNLLFKGSFNDHIVELAGIVGTPEGLMNDSPIDIDLTLKAAGAEVKITGNIQQPSAGDGLNLALSAKSDNIARLAELAGAQVGKVGPFEMAATVSGAQMKYKIGGLNIKIADSDLSGDISADLTGKVPQIDVALASELLNIKDVTPASAEDGASPKTTAPAQTTKTPAKSEKIFPADPIILDGLKAVNANVTYTAKKLIASDFALTDFKKKVTLNNGLLNVQPAFAMGGGVFDGQVTLDGRNSPAKLKIDLTGKDLGLGNSLKETGVTDLIDDGKTQIRLNLDATGTSVAGLMASLEGKTLVNVGQGRIKSSKVNFLGGDLITGVLENILPSASEGEFTPFSCIVVNLDFNKGVTEFDKKIAVQTNVMNVASSGKIDLANETLDIGVKPEPRGDTADLGINVGGLASMVRVSGPLSAPGIGIDAFETAKAAMGVGAAIATGGMSVLFSGLTDKALADGDPCATALGQKSSAGNGASTTDSAPQQKQQESDNPIGGLLNLFGKTK